MEGRKLSLFPQVLVALCVSIKANGLDTRASSSGCVRFCPLVNHVKWEWGPLGSLHARGQPATPCWGRALKAQHTPTGFGELHIFTKCFFLVGSDFGCCFVQSEEDEGELGDYEPYTQAFTER